ncbi:DeoR family transcriptional regulator [bacterium]|nr:DeoR family transcriptional regulator [bacterium]
MKLAIEEMSGSRSEHSHKADPLVGAVLVSAKGNELAQAGRGSLRVGNHAEYLVIERLSGDKNLEGSTLYITLEPCTSRGEGKKPCVEWIVKARIGRVVIGIPDPNPEIHGHGITYLLDQNVDVDFFDQDLREQIRRENQDFIDHYMDLSEEKQLQEEFEGSSEREQEPVLSATVDDFSWDAIQEYIDIRGKHFSKPSPELWSFFHKNGFLSIHPKRRTYVPTIAGLLLFGESPEDFLVQSKLKLEAEIGGKLILEDVAGPLPCLPEKIEEFFSKNMRTYTEIKGFKREAVTEYPLEALREAVINAIVHRDYTAGARVLIQMTPKSIIIKSPGYLLRPLTLDQIRKCDAPPYSRNPRIAETFNMMNLMEERGRGLKNMRDLLVKHGLRPPRFDYESGYFVVTFFGQELAPGVIRIPSELMAKLNNRQQELIDLVRNRGRITSAECAERFKVSIDTAKRDLKKLVELGILEKRGLGPATFYALIGA